LVAAAGPAHPDGNGVPSARVAPVGDDGTDAGVAAVDGGVTVDVVEDVQDAEIKATLHTRKIVRTRMWRTLHPRWGHRKGR
jgi:hypothetical protein